MAATLKNIVVVGGSFVGKATAQELAQIVPNTHRILLIEPHSHFHHLFTFVSTTSTEPKQSGSLTMCQPRFAVLPGHEHKAFIPYTGLFPKTSNHAVIQARALSLQPHHIQLDREWQGSTQIPFEYLVAATGTRLVEPAGMRNDDKLSSVTYLQNHQADVKRAKSIVIVGGGAVGVQMATDLKESCPDKKITVVQSRLKLMPQFHERLHEIVKGRFDELGVELVTGSRIAIPPNGFPKNSTPFTVQLTNGTELSTDFVIMATGQTPNNSIVKGLPPSTSTSIANPDNGFIRIRPTMQFQDPKYPNLFAVGDIADTGVRKAAKPGAAQAAVVAKNIHALLEGREPGESFPRIPAAIHITLGHKYNIIFRNPNVAEGQTEPTLIEKFDGRADMGVEGMWQRLGVGIEDSRQYHL